MTRHQVTCINKRGDHYDAHQRISHIGGYKNDRSRWKLTEEEAIKGMENRTYEFYVNVNGVSVDVIIATHANRKYLKTATDGYAPNNLLNLPECV
jgi:hypothetical protein